jgi:peptidyl-tRNA hydrolase
MERNKDEEVVMYLIVNKDLNMSAGKIAAQVGHAVHTLTCLLNEILSKNYISFLISPDKEIFQTIAIDCYNWQCSSTKIILEANKEEFLQLYDYQVFHI